jgi:hypothetical protein
LTIHFEHKEILNTQWAVRDETPKCKGPNKMHGLASRHTETDPNPGIGRRNLLRGVLAAAGSGVLLAAAGPAMGAEAVGPGKGTTAGEGAMRNAGAGMHVGPDTAMGISTFTICANSVSCGVGSLGNSPGAVPGTSSLPTGLGTSGVFAMLMYATKIDSFKVDSTKRQLIATGTMRSITTAGNQTIEDVLHPFVAVGQDNRKSTPDVFHLHFLTPFWTPASNPMATASDLKHGWSMFGSTILLGEINVSS